MTSEYGKKPPLPLWVSRGATLLELIDAIIHKVEKKTMETN